jgi:zinc/manganese transport system ATP-binding protein
VPSSPTLTEHVARLRAVHVDFGGREALCHVDLDIAPGAITVIAGPNGAGKSTLIEVIAGTRPPSSGERLARGAIAFVPQRATASDRLPVSVRDVVAVGTWGALGPWRRTDAARAAIDEALRRLAIEGLSQHPFVSLSGGQRQRALLAQGLARSADLLLLDEPTTGLDAESGRLIRAALRSEAARGAAVVCVSHDPEVLAAADLVVRMESGRIV